MRLIDELRAASAVVIDANWPETVEALAKFIRDTHAEGRGCVVVACHTDQVRERLESWAEQQGLVFRRLSGGFSVGLVVIKWDEMRTPVIFLDWMDCEILADGTLRKVLRDERNPAPNGSPTPPAGGNPRGKSKFFWFPWGTRP